MSSAREIAAKLSKAQRKRLSEMVWAHWYNDRRGEMYLRLMLAGLLEREGPKAANYRLTPLGLEVRSILQEKQHG